MGAKEFIVLTITLSIIVISQAQYYGRMRGLNSIYKDHCTCTCEDLSSLIALARILEEREIIAPPPPPPPPPSNSGPCLSNFEELIMKLVNALVYTTTETAKNKCCCSHSAPSVPSTGTNNQGNNGGHDSNSYHSHSEGGLIDVDVLNKNKNSNVLDLDVAHQHLVGVGLGGHGNQPTGQKTSGHDQTGQQPTGHTNNPSSDTGLVNLDLLNPNKPANVAELDLGKEKVLGVGLGGGGGAPSSNSGSSNNTPSSGEGLINVDVLNPKNQNNVVDLDLAGKNLVGVGLGN